MEKTKQFLKDYKWAVLFAAVAVMLFYWYEMRPIFIYRNCAEQASADARALLASKADIAKGSPQGEAYERLKEKNLYLRSDYESFLMKCLMHHGMQIVPVDQEALPKEAINPDAAE